ncbi:hypothetical protein ILYODFUR_038013 [Ilyodon furcidens]|uniref:Uncharacterized protein n=1 Tax=Ilyodon furcidens TaxID=33524 RepID=A0ABV0T5A4_9TELE
MAPALSAAELQRRYRAKRDADPERRARYLQKEPEKWQQDRETGKKKRIADLTEREKRAQRKKWRDRKREAKAREKAMGKAMAVIPSSPYTPDTPNAPNTPTSPSSRPSTHNTCNRPTSNVPTGPSPAEYSRFDL